MEKRFSVRQIKAAFGLEESDLQLPAKELEEKLAKVKLSIGKTKNGLFMWSCGGAQGPSSENAYLAAKQGREVVFVEKDDSLICQVAAGMTEKVDL